MIFKDVVNRNIVNLDNCESEPIHVPGSIQPHGFLIAVKSADKIIEFCSENVFEFTGLTYLQLLGKDLAILLTDDNGVDLLRYLHSTAHFSDAPVSLTINSVKLECVLHSFNELIILEFEVPESERPDSNSLYSQTRQFIRYIENANSLKSLCQFVVGEIRAMTGYDRVMVYRFDEQYNGEVFAESCNHEIEPFLGLHYPHTDIPAQARELYTKNLLRLIVDVKYKPQAIYTIDDGNEKLLDMSYCSLRSVSPIHIQYLQNMGVGATLTISLIHENKLWGLIACHHYSPKYISNHVRISAKLQGHFLTSQIRVREAAEEYDLSKQVEADVRSLITNQIIKNRESFHELIEKKELRQLCHANGVALMVDNLLHTFGAVPGITEVKKLGNWLNEISYGGHYRSDKLSTVYEGAKELGDNGSGILFHSLGSAANYIIWFRQETLTEVTWGGDPDKAILKDENGLHPRKSFARWREIIKGKSNPWLNPEINAAANFSHALQRQVHLLFITEEEIKYRKLSYQLQATNAELENMNWIGAHDLQEPLRKIQTFASRLLTKSEVSVQLIHSDVTKIMNSAERMQLLIDDILSYSRIVKSAQPFVLVNLNDELASVLNELDDEIHEKNAVITVDTLSAVQGIPFMIRQLFLNLLRNSLKFAKENISPLIEITQERSTLHTFLSPNTGEEKRYYEVQVRDNGIGFEPLYNDHIFKVFTRLHTQDQYSGTGVGLALCKKIMQNHNGLIKAESQIESGAIFKIYFPAN